jgi:hypothetical protein
VSYEDSIVNVFIQIHSTRFFMGGETCYSLLLFVQEHLLLHTHLLRLLSAIQIVPFDLRHTPLSATHNENPFYLPCYSSVTAGPG